jgi:ABC-2 type transport system permease protein
MSLPRTILPVGSFAWLVLHEFRLTSRAAGGRRWATYFGWAMIAVWCVAGVLIAMPLRDVPIESSPLAMTIIAAAAIGLFTFMSTQALLASQRALYEAGDLDLLFSSPLDASRIVSAKLAGIVGTVALTFALIVLPLAIPIAAFGHPQLFGIPALLATLALAAACLGLVLTLALSRLAGPRAARTVGQIAAALAGGAFFIASQLMGRAGRDDDRSGMETMFETMRDNGFGTHGFWALPGKAAFGDPLAIALLLGGAVLLFAATSWGMRTWFLASWRDGRMRLSRQRKAKGGIAKHFHAGLAASIFAKEWRLLARDPALAFQIVLRLIYLAPLMFIALRDFGEGGLPLAPSLAFSSVVIAGQLGASLAWLAASAEDSPDLLKVAPVEKDELDQAKLFAALAMAAPMIVLLPIGIAFESIPDALVALFFTGVTAALTAYLEVSNAKPQPRSTFQRKGSGSFVLAIVGFVIAMILGLVAGVIVYFV